MNPSEYLNRKFASGKPRACWMCNCTLSRWIATVDHLQPQKAGGKDAADNYRLACKPCNSARGHALLSKAQRMALKGREPPKGRDYSKLTAAIQRARTQA